MNGATLPVRDRPVAERVAIVLQRREDTRYYRLSKHDSAGREVDYRNPLEELMAREELAEQQAAMDALSTAQRVLDLHVLPDALVAQIHALVLDHFRQVESELVEWFFGGGIDPLEATKRLFAYAKQKRADLIRNMNFRDLGDLFGETHANNHARHKGLFPNDPAPWNKGDGAKRNMADAQQGNVCRKGGRKANPLRNALASEAA